MILNRPPEVGVSEVLDDLNAPILGRPTYGEMQAREWQEVLETRTVEEGNPLSPHYAGNDNSLWTDFFL